MGDASSRRPGAGNLFMVFGEPDIDVTSVAERPSHRRDPRRRRLRPHDRRRSAPTSTDDIACWFIDTDYNGESFFVRHAYFTGGNDPTTASRKPCAPKSTKKPGKPSTRR